MTKRDPVNPTDDAARALAHRLIAEAAFGALAVQAPDGPAPIVSRVAVAAFGGVPHLLISDLSVHTAELKACPDCSILLGEPGDTGDPLTHPRLTFVAEATPADKAALRDGWLNRHPKAKLYYDFADFRLMALSPRYGLLNGGFGKAYRLSAADMTG